MNATATPEGFGVRDFAAAAGISIGATYRALYEGRLPAQRILGRWLIPKDEARKFIRRRQAKKGKQENWGDV